MIMVILGVVVIACLRMGVPIAHLVRKAVEYITGKIVG